MKKISVVAIVLLMVAAPAFAATNDPYFARLWGLHRVGAEPAWAASKGAGVMIAVIDTGVDTNHPDLQGKLLPGYDFVSNDAVPKDEEGHGTLVAGIAGALTGNKVGIASIAPDAKILPVRVFDGTGNGNSNTVADGVNYAIKEAGDRNMRLVLNFSFVPEGPTSGSSFFADPKLELAVRSAINAGAALVIAAGNSGANQTAYDSTNAEIVVVGASDKSDNRASLSNYGAGLDILAPGIDITSTYWDKATGNSVYASAQGTSTSVPFVSGAAALLMAKGMNGKAALNKILEHRVATMTPVTACSIS
ncbi:MAG: S8 family serine peptidase, partial [Actinomycetota bacterium]